MTAEVAARAGVTRQAVQQWVKAGKLRPVAQAVGWVFTPAEVDRALRARARTIALRRANGSA